MSNVINTTSTYFVIGIPPIASSWIDSTYDNFNTSQGRKTLTMLMPLIIVFFFLVCFFAIYLFHDILRDFVHTWIQNVDGRDELLGRDQRPETTSRGLNPTILCSFPVYPYSSIKKLRKKKFGLVCAICLSEFSDNDAVRLLTVCNHAFHPDCIDPWLEENVTCPVCRCDLEKNLVESHCICLIVEAEEENGHRLSIEEFTSTEAANVIKRVPVEEEDDDDVYTLRIPENSTYLTSVVSGKDDITLAEHLR